MATSETSASAVAADILRRYLKFKGYKVTHVMNITDVEDRIIAESQKAGLEYRRIHREVHRRALGRLRRARLRAARHRSARDATHSGDGDADRETARHRSRLSIRRFDLLPHRFVSGIRQALEDQLRGKHCRRQ